MDLGYSLGQPCIVLASIASTSTHLRELAEAGAAPGTVVRALAQTGGYGQRGRTWASPPGGGLYFSCLLPMPKNPTHLPFIVGMGCHDAMTQHGVASGLKWVNDLVANERKLGGILIEGSRWGAIAGIGINLLAPALPEAIGLAELSTVALDADEVFQSVLAAIESRLAQVAVEGFEPIRRDWSAASVTLGRAVVVQGGDRDISGVAESLGPYGELFVREPDGVLATIVSGTVRRSNGAYC